MITEEALPTYMTMLNTLDGVRDETGASPTPWGIWTRAWTAEENRHGDLMNKYMYLTGRVNMKSIEVGGLACVVCAHMCCAGCVWMWWWCVCVWGGGGHELPCSPFEPTWLHEALWLEQVCSVVPWQLCRVWRTAFRVPC
jgi:hypothetical protein